MGSGHIVDLIQEATRLGVRRKGCKVLQILLPKFDRWFVNELTVMNFMILVSIFSLEKIRDNLSHLLY